MGRRGLAGYLPLALITSALGCASSARSTAETYEDVGRFDMALVYRGQAYLDDRSEGLKADVIRTFELAVRSLAAEVASAPDPLRRLGISLREESLVDQLRAIGLGELGGGRGAISAHADEAKKAALAKVDAAEVAGKSSHEMAILTREALALDPNNAELTARWWRLRESLRRDVSVELVCPPAAMSACQQLRDRIVAGVGRARPEFLDFVSSSAKTKSAVLSISAEVTAKKSAFSRVQAGEARCTLPVEDRFRRVVANEHQTVSAKFSTFQASSEAAVSFRVEITDLRPPSSALFQHRGDSGRSSVAGYLDFEGDSRAFCKKTLTKSSSGELFETDNPFAAAWALGTNHSPPVEPERLISEIVDELAEGAIRALAARLEDPL
ncbi:MAG: hypothetical protein HYV07_27805 [Deltaproteobacteria bacterium]|nr:hypothetical protein [Deltaproteobacteria bacterium]